jgi:hypothetical protein
VEVTASPRLDYLVPYLNEGCKKKWYQKKTWSTGNGSGPANRNALVGTDHRRNRRLGGLAGRRAQPLGSHPPAGRSRAEGEEMSGIRKSTDFGLTNAERKSLRETEAQEAMSDHDGAERPSTKTGIACGRRGWHARLQPVRSFIQRQAFRMKRLSTTSDFQQESPMRSTRRV